MKRNVAVGRHTGSADYVKLNLAVLYGWRVLRFTTEMLKKDPQGCVDVLRRALDRFGVEERRAEVQRKLVNQARTNTFFNLPQYPDRYDGA